MTAVKRVSGKEKLLKFSYRGSGKEPAGKGRTITWQRGWYRCIEFRIICARRKREEKKNTHTSVLRGENEYITSGEKRGADLSLRRDDDE